ncbi:Regulatory protein OS=Streptomyces alboniger OX=132473 GN=CP975_01000 PE=4 SV=1 [Streptomyces alboniger]
MSQNTSVTELTSQYTAQVATDLERNTKEQERIGGEIAALQEQLAALQRDHTVLTNIQQAIGTAPASAQPVAPSDSVAVPAPRKKSATASGTGKRAGTKKFAPQPGRAAAGKSAADGKSTAEKPAAAKATAGKAAVGKATSAKSTAAKATAGKSAAGKSAAEKPAGKPAAAKSAQPTLVDLVRRHLTEQKEPRSAAEITTALDKSHPERGVKTTVVRTTLEGLVAKSQAQRSKQGASVFYTAP